MKTIYTLGVCLLLAAAVPASRAADLKQSRITQVVNDVEIISAAAQQPKPAAINDIFSIPDVLRTGKASRAELVAKDDTVTRIGADTIFSFDPASRTIDLKRGSLLFHSPHGKGGGTIHTGSATASVLGTTLIVTATPDGGMKVLDLEGKVEVHFPNIKKSQRLAPGQMTFVLPGGKELAPVLVFRLDELVKNSLLVQGFGAPLPSLPLIQKQIDRQLKLIKSGRASDTGLLVGESATPNQVQVLDLNTLQNQVNRPNVQDEVPTDPNTPQPPALLTDATITQPSLTDKNIPTPPNRLFFDQALSLPGNSFFSGQTFKGFAGRNVTFVTAEPLTVDLSPFSTKPVFDIVAAKNLNFLNTVIFNGLSSASQLSLIGGENIFITPGITLQANVANLKIATPGMLALDGVTLLNNIGKLGLTSGSAIEMNNVFLIPAGTTTYTAPAAVNFNWGGEGYLGKFGPSDDNIILTDPRSGSVKVSAGSLLTVNSTTITTHYLTLNSGDSILLDSSGRALTATGSGATATFTAPNLVTVRNANLSNFGVVNMAANTLNLSDVAFGAGSLVTLKSLLGDLNVGSSLPGRVNFIQNVTYGGNPAQNYVNNGGGITVTKLH
jgi:hypothetical protein